MALSLVWWCGCEWVAAAESGGVYAQQSASRSIVAASVLKTSKRSLDFKAVFESIFGLCWICEGTPIVKRATSLFAVTRQGT